MTVTVTQTSLHHEDAVIKMLTASVRPPKIIIRSPIVTEEGLCLVSSFLEHSSKKNKYSFAKREIIQLHFACYTKISNPKTIAVRSRSQTAIDDSVDNSFSNKGWATSEICASDI